jgi:hypothetical protein
MMLLSSERKKFQQLQAQIAALSKKPATGFISEDNRKNFDTLRAAFRLFEDVVQRVNKSGREIEGEDGERLRELVGNAIMSLGGVADPSPISLRNYNHALYGPFLGVSDEGSAVHNIRRAALTSPKVKALGRVTPIQVGVAHDAERLAAVGEVAVGPEEYRDIILGGQGSILTTTNVGTRLNLRYYKMRPIVRIPKGPIADAIRLSTRKIKELTGPFTQTPDRKPRPLTILAYFDRKTSFTKRLAILKGLTEAMAKSGFCNPKYHKLGLLADVVWGQRGLTIAKVTIDLANKAGILEVSFQGEVRWEAENKISMPGLLNYFRPQHLSDLLDYAQRKKVEVSPKNLVDPDTVARNVWGGLQAARGMGLHLGKYGLFPLTFGESGEVMGQIQRWFSDWAAAPAFYIDFPHLSRNAVYTEEDIVPATKNWLNIVSRHGIPIVLLDTADKDKGRKLLKSGPGDRVGILTMGQITDIDRYASKRGIRCLWAGGVTLSQAFELGKLKLYGIYVTTSAAEVRPVSKRYARDPMLAAEREPTFHGVYRTKLLLEAGFLVSRLRELGAKGDAEVLKDKALALLESFGRRTAHKNANLLEAQLASLTEEGWRKHFKHKAPGPG